MSQYRIHIISFSIVAFVLIAGYGLQQHYEASQAEQQLNLLQLQSVVELSTYVSQMDVTLQKGVYATSPSLMASLCTQVYTNAISAQLALGKLPDSHLYLLETGTFLSQVGDFALDLSQSCYEQGVYTETQQSELEVLAQGTSDLSQALMVLQAQCLNQSLDLSSDTKDRTAFYQTMEEAVSDLTLSIS